MKASWHKGNNVSGIGGKIMINGKLFYVEVV